MCDMCIILVHHTSRQLRRQALAHQRSEEHKANDRSHQHGEEEERAMSKDAQLPPKDRYEPLKNLFHFSF